MAENPWDDDYQAKNMRWDTGMPDPMLVAAVIDGSLVPCRIVEIGCGTGTNARFLVEQGFEVVGLDVSPTAIALARDRVDRAQFATHDIIADPVPNGPFDAAFDRGCFHIFDSADDRAVFAQRIADALRPGGLWLSHIGSTEGPPREMGPPRRSAQDILGATEPVLELYSLTPAAFADSPSSPSGWRALFRKRTEPAQPSAGRER